MTLQARQDQFDVCVVGSGAGGAMTAWALVNAGARVVMLEAGEWWDNTRDSKMLSFPWQSPRRGASTRERPFGEFDACIGGWNVEGEPFTRAPGARFDWWRARMLGGRTNHWGRISLRFGPDDFRRKSIDGLGDDWPITYDDLKPWYDRVDRLIGIFGNRDNLPNHPDGIFMAPPRPRCYELAVKQAADRLGIWCIAGRLSVITRPLNNRAPCHYCGQCNRGCMTNSNFSAPNVLLFPARRTGRLTIRVNAMAREVGTGDNGLATGVHYVDKATGRDNFVRARVVVLAASACESARILLNSKSPRHPQGLANASGVVGRYLTDTTGTDVMGYIPRFADHVPHNCDGVGGGHIYMPWWLDNARLDFPRGYHIEVWGGLGVPSYGFGGGIQNMPGSRGGGYGTALKDEYRKYYGSTVGFSGRGEQIPNADCYCEIDPEAKDRWGIPVLRFHWKWTDHEHRQVKHMQETFRTLIRELGGEPMGSMPGPERGYGIATGGSIIHELGTVRMGADERTSALDSDCRSWSCRNLFVTDGGPFVSQADKNPTWTIMALAWRTADRISQLVKAREV